MLAAPIPKNDTQRLAALRAHSCAYAPREERFDRITRTVKRLLHVPVALISIVEQDELWFRSVQGLEIAHAPRDVSFCGHAIAINKPLCIPDTWADANFFDNPLVTGPPGIRAYLGWPLEISPGLAVGSLCAIDTIPRMFSNEECEALRDLAAMAEAELKISAMADLQGKLMMRLDTLQRRGALDPLTGCWNIRGFRELLALGVEEARGAGTELAICSVRVSNLDDLAVSAAHSNRDALTLMLAQVLRQRLPPHGALARLAPSHFCALIPATSAIALEDALAKLTFPTATVNLPDKKLSLELPLSIHISWLADLDPSAGPQALWAQALRLHSA
ncbi:MAG: GAF domain-containing protein [Polaromonas sp.]|nr:GAF domain-containing protein [Polaromonas sp.]